MYGFRGSVPHALEPAYGVQEQEGAWKRTGSTVQAGAASGDQASTLELCDLSLTTLPVA